MADTSDRTLPASPRRREAARRDGAMPTAAAPAWAASAATVVMLGPAWLRATVPAAADMFRTTLPASRAPDLAALMPAALLVPTVGLVLAAGGVGLAVRLFLDGPGWQPGRAVPDLRRIDPFQGLARIVSVRSLGACLGGAVGLAVLVAAGVRAAAPLAGVAASGAAFEDPGLLVAAAWRPLAWLVVAAAAVAVAQWAVARRRFEAAIRMTPEEYADESRSMQADPTVRLLQWRRGRPTVRRPDGPGLPTPEPGSRTGR